MSSASKLELISVEDYLEGEQRSEIKHEYLGGVIYAMAGANNAHNMIATNCLVQLGIQLDGKKCRPFNSDTKVRFQGDRRFHFYYPDAMVVCDPNPQSDTFQDHPVVIVEVLSDSTRRIDEGEKRDAYFQIKSLQSYLLIEQTPATAVVYRRRGENWEGEAYRSINDIIDLPEINAQLELKRVYSGVTDSDPQ